MSKVIVSEKNLIGSITVLTLTLIISFMPWYSVYDKYYDLLITVNAWNGWMSSWNIKIHNSILIIFNILFLILLILKNYQVIQIKLVWLTPMYLVVLSHTIIVFSALVLDGDKGNISLKLGYFLYLFTVVCEIVLGLTLKEKDVLISEKITEAKNTRNTTSTPPSIIEKKHNTQSISLLKIQCWITIPMDEKEKFCEGMIRRIHTQNITQQEVYAKSSTLISAINEHSKSIENQSLNILEVATKCMIANKL